MASFLFVLPVLILLLYLSVIFTSQAMVLFTFSCAIFYVLSLIYLSVSFFLVTGRVDIPISVADVGKPATIQVFIRNRSPFPVFHARLFFEVKNSFEKKKIITEQNIFQILPGENRFEFSLALEAAGNYEVGLKKLRIYDMLSLFSVTKKISSGKNIQVMPQILEIPVFLTAPVKNFFGDSDFYDEEKRGYDQNEIFQIRPYVPGDKLQSIHWKLSAKTDELMVKESSLPKACAVVLLLQYQRKKKKKGSFGIFLELGASLSFSLMNAGCPHYVVWYEEEIRDITRMRVDNEESFYLFLSYYLKEQGGQASEELSVLYDEKYRTERYLHSLHLNEDFVLYKDGEELLTLRPDLLRQHLGGLEIVL